MSLFEKIFGTYSSKQIKKIEPTVKKVEALADKYAAMSDAELRDVTPALKSRLSGGETLDDILPDAFAAVREAATRVLGKRPFRVQIMGGIILHQGRIAEMKTGEGKTLVATMPAYLNALTGGGVHIVTVNDYLARRDSEEMGKVYGFLGLTTGLIVHEQSNEDKKAAYACDITYGTNNEIGFDYLRDNMIIYKERLVQRGHNFAIVDEVDSILIDEARTPLIISGQGSASDEMYGKADAFVRSLRALRIKEKDTKDDYDDVKEDYIVDEKGKRATLTSRGIEKAEKFFGVENYADVENTDLTHYVNQALHAHGVMKRDVDYVVMEGKVLIVDSFTGRIMPGRRFSDGLHQAIEAKERVKIENENQTLATITFQNFFRLYKKLSGMTGTALTEEEEFRSIYSLDVVEVPTNKPMIRVDHNDAVYKNERGKFAAIIEQIKECHEKGQPVLVGTVSVDKSELLSKLLSREGIKHNVLNAKYHAKEAEIIAQAGKYGAVTISTNMAGRGTDIMLGGNAEFLAKTDLRKLGYNEEEILAATGSAENIGEREEQARGIFREKLALYKEQIAPEAAEVRKAGGLFILGTERHESRRIDNQLRGRSGRQGDPGESRFYLSFEDDLLRLFGSERIMGVVDRLGLPDDQPIDAAILSGTIENAQTRLEGENFNRRKTVLDYDDVMNQHRNVIYGERRRVLDGEDISETIAKMITGCISDGVAESISMESGKLDLDALRKNVFWMIGKDDFAEEREYTQAEVTEMLCERASEIYAKQSELFGENIRELERVALLRAVDTHWMQHLDAMDDLRGSIGLSAYAQRNPLNEYRIAAGEMFEAMIANIRVDTVRMILFSRPVEQIKRTQIAKQREAQAANVGGEDTKKQPVVKKSADKVGRNDPCPCGSGKKYKKCCGASGSGKED
jgi:preprotein translocase subunit SecA